MSEGILEIKKKIFTSFFLSRVPRDQESKWGKEEPLSEMLLSYESAPLGLSCYAKTERPFMSVL